MLRVTLVLSAADRQALQQLIKHDPHWRVRERAQSLLLLATGLTCQQVAEQQALSMQTVSATRRRWLALGLVGLPDRARKRCPGQTHRRPDAAVVNLGPRLAADLNRPEGTPCRRRRGAGACQHPDRGLEAGGVRMETDPA